MFKQKKYLVALVIGIFCIGGMLFQFYQVQKDNAYYKEIAEDVYQNYVLITDEAGNDITEQFQQEYEQDYKEGNYKAIVEELNNVNNTKILDMEGNPIQK